MSPAGPVPTADTPHAPPFRLYLLGGASVIGPNGPVDAVSGDDQLIAVLALVATAKPETATLEAVAVTVRPDLAPVDAVAALRDDLQRLAVAFGQEVVVAREGWLTLDPALVWSDVASYRGHLARGDRLAAAADYQGPFVDRFHLPGAAAFNQWMHAERAAFALAFRELAVALAGEAMASRDGQAAARWWTRLVDADPWNPRAAEQAMDGFEAMGEQPAAIAVAEEYLSRSAERLGREPDRAIASRLVRLRQPGPARNRPSRLPLGLLGAGLVVVVVLLVWWLA